MDIESLCIHGGKIGTDSSGAISTPIYQTATYAHPGLGKSTGFDYSRGMNPTRGVLQDTMAKLEGGVAAYEFSSGLAAASAMMEGSLPKIWAPQMLPGFFLSSLALF